MSKFYQVGGSVRDELLGLKSKDVDYAVEAGSFDDMRRAILDRGGDIFLETPQYFTIRAKVPEFGPCDFVLCRKESNYRDGRHPETVEVGTIWDDLARRDFTVNAMARSEDGAIIDPHGGQDDLRNGLLRCVGGAEARFTEDGLRMLRAIRFAVTRDLYINDDIHGCLSRESFYKPNLVGVSPERIREELVKCFQHDTNRTLHVFGAYLGLRAYLFSGNVWLKPTLERR